MQTIAIPQTTPDYWTGTTEVPCPCGGMIHWAEAAYVPGSRACDRCLVLFAVRGRGADRRLVPQGHTDPGIIEDIGDDEAPYHVPDDYFRGRG